jgi:predicted DNA-binding protein
MKTQLKSTAAGITVRFPAATRERVTRLAQSEHRSAAAYIEQLVERDLRLRDEAERIVRIYVAADVPEPTGEVLRGEGETTEDHANRTEILNELFGVT